MDAQTQALIEELAWYEPWRQYLRPLPLRLGGDEPVIFDLGEQGERVLDMLCEYDTASPSIIAREAHVSQETIYSILSRLAEQGYVERVKRARYRITPEGRKAAITPNPRVWFGNREVIDW